MRILLLAAGLLAGLSLSAQAAEVLELDSVVVRSSRLRFPQQPQQLTRIEADAIRASGAADLAQLLKSQPGIAIREYGAAGSLATPTMRGALGEGILVLRDGIRLNSPERGGTDFSTVSLVGVKRVEILHGAASGLYGSEAVGGVIHLISDDAPANRLQADLGTWGQRSLATELTGRLGETRLAFGLRRREASNDYPFTYRGVTAPRANDALASTELRLGGDRPLNHGRLRADLSLLHRQKGLPGPVNFPSPNAHQQDLEAQASTRWSQWLLPTVEQAITLSHRHAELRYADPDSPYSKASESLLSSTDAQTQLLWVGDAHEARIGAGFRLDSVTGSTIGAHEQLLGSAFVHDSWFVTPALTAFGNLRLDHHPSFGLEASPRLGLTYQLGRPLRLRASVGRAYRAPTLNDRYWPRLGNPALRPERSEVYEIGLDAAEGPWSLESTVFFNRGTDTILWQPGAGGDWSPVNAGRTETRGIEIKGRYQPFESLSLAGGGTWLSAIDAAEHGPTAGKALLYRPALLADLSATYRPWKPLALFVGWSFTGERFTTAQNTDSLPAHGLVSARLTYEVDARQTFSLRGENLANQYYVLQPYYPMPGRTFAVSWDIRF